MNLGGMRFSVTDSAIWNEPVNAAMAISTGKGMMFCPYFRQLLTLFRVTWEAIRAWGSQGIMDFQGLVDRMATFTVTQALLFRVRFMTLKTLRNVTMFIMAVVTGQLGMLAGKVIEFPALLRVTGKTRFGYFAFDNNI
jgi:hypothetical protein